MDMYPVGWLVGNDGAVGTGLLGWAVGYLVGCRVLAAGGNVGRGVGATAERTYTDPPLQVPATPVVGEYMANAEKHGNGAVGTPGDAG
jgi:hypothetical protein